jgi:16S rRNA (guanine527-N7)-methyltransferase
LEPFGLALSSDQEDCLVAYLDLLLRWGSRINLTAIGNAEECVTRHFGESLYLARWIDLHGQLLDIGSGAGFPGLALKIVAPELAVTLLEPVTKKRAFLKEVARTCKMHSVEVRGDRLEDFSRSRTDLQFDLATARAVGRLGRLVANARQCLKPAGHLCLWVSRDQSNELQFPHSGFEWRTPIPIPLSRQREIWIDTKAGTPSRNHA